MLQITGVKDCIKTVGVLSHGSLLDWLMTLDAYVLPSVTEGCPNILMEAMAAGLPVKAARTGAIDDLIENGVSGMIVPKADSSALAQAILSICKDPGTASNMGNKARHGMQQFSSELESYSWSKAYEELLGS